MPDWKLSFTEFDRKGRAYTYPYVFGVDLRAFDQDRHASVFVDGVNWCRDRFGYHTDVFRTGAWSIEFKDETFALEFKMRWC